jgi:D-arabinose 1-dehydrogenase-like Zn-dependent alcohol dehydrogenase|tara:strand:+ start:280 stop:462 length:183 start_codon:yes stop_codon:yes gene_type:complete
MKVGNLVKRSDDHAHHGIVVEVGPQETVTDHGRTVAKVQWNDGDLTCEFVKTLEVLSEGR